ncbi:DUF1214 domain-containing protein [Solimonas flava]|uniref:DUF1214 domain-containing protein n=1 Tax=Solimonas flava TaxID=415849 RepID=UPI0005BCE853|nr:DUF1214 domain-containing protein [Solimonas flava]
MRSAFAVFAAVLVGIAAGFGSAWLVLDNGQLLSRTEYDYWFGNEKAGSTAADPYTRGIIAKIGLLALNRSETIYFHRYKDQDGRQLREGCVYEMSGGNLPARWWSITAYAGDDFLPVNGDGAYSVDATQLQRDADGRWRVRIAATRGDAANWISTRHAGSFNLALRMYNPDAGARDDVSTIPYPTITRLNCSEGHA